MIEGGSSGGVSCYVATVDGLVYLGTRGQHSFRVILAVNNAV